MYLKSNSSSFRQAKFFSDPAMKQSVEPSEFLKKVIFRMVLEAILDKIYVITYGNFYDVDGFVISHAIFLL